MSKPHVAFLGLGIMGSGMARRLLANGFPLSVFNRSPEKSNPFATEGARVAASPREAASGAQVVISMLADDRAARGVWMGDAGALGAAAPGTLCIECSTVTLGWVRELSAATIARGCGFLDAPVTGSKAQAASGELNFLVGGPAETLEQARPVLAAMSKTILPLGPVGSGALLKLINNFVCGVEIAALAEAMAMIERAGLDRDKALEIIANGAPGSPLVKAVSGRMTRQDYAPNFLLRLMAKDLGYAIQEGNSLSLELLTAAPALNRFQNAIEAGSGEQDIAAVVEPLRATRS
jgi:3-hydroxyisobutyrate dehydrogenase